MTRRGRQQELADERASVVLVPHTTERSRDESRASNAVQWHVYVFRTHGGAADESINLVAERTLAGGASEDLGQWLGTWKPARAIVVLPPSATVCRTCPLPALGAGKAEQMLSALRLQSETAFMGGIAGHRLSMAVLPPGFGESLAAGSSGNRQGVIIGWPESAEYPEPPALPSYTDVAYTATISALLGLVSSTHLSEPIIRADRLDRSILFILSGPQGVVLRSTLEDADDDATWRDSVLRSAAETLISNDATPEEIARVRSLLDDHFRSGAAQGDATFLSLPSGVREMVLRRLPGSSFDGHRALALGAMFASGRGAAGNAAGLLLGELTSMRASLPKPKPQPIQLALQRLQSPRIAGTVIAASIAAFLFSPLLFAVARNGVLRLKLDDLQSYEAANREVHQKAALYQALSRTTWPMTKLLGDLSNSLPDTVDIDSIQIESGQRITIRGFAKPLDKSGDKPVHMSAREVALAIEPRARDTGIFKEFEIKVDADDGRGCSFTVSCSVSNPIKQYAWKKEDDNAETSRRDRLYPNWRDIEKGSGHAGSATAHADEAAPESDSGSRIAHAGGDKPTPTDGEVTAHTDEPKSARPSNGARSGRRPDSPDGAGKPSAKPAVPAGAHGEEADPTDAKVVEGDAKEGEHAAEDEADGEKSRPGAASDRGINRRKPEGSGSGTDRPATPQPSAPKVSVPAAFSDDELNGMSLAQAKDLLSSISVARGSATLDDATKERLSKDFYRVLERLKELQKQKAGS